MGHPDSEQEQKRQKMNERLSFGSLDSSFTLSATVEDTSAHWCGIFTDDVRHTKLLHT